MFADRISAGRRLAGRLMHLRPKHPVVLALPRGGVPVAAMVADALDAPLDLILVRKIGAPHQPELAIGAIADGGGPLVELDADSIELLGVSGAYIAAEKTRQWETIERRRLLYRQSRPPLALTGRTVIIVDDGVATGATMRVAIAAARQAGATEIVVAVPVASRQATTELRAVADAIICLDMPEDLFAIGAHYADFAQLTDEEVREYLASRPLPVESQGAPP